jgi:hypothetical protein
VSTWRAALEHWKAIGGATLLAAAIAAWGMAVAGVGRHDQRIRAEVTAADDLTSWRAGVDQHVQDEKKKEGDAAEHFRTIEAGQLALLLWAGRVSERLHVEPPPLPVSLTDGRPRPLPREARQLVPTEADLARLRVVGPTP